MIRTFRDLATEDLYHGRETNRTRRLPIVVRKIGPRKLDMLAAAQELIDLRVPPGNRLEPLHGDREGFYSIRINDQWRIVFRWLNGGAEEVEIEDYH